jgi:hypothetical protein
MPGKSVLLVEGQDDEIVISEIALAHGIPKFAKPKQLKSVEALLREFPLELDASELRVLGMVLDANGDPAARWHSIRDKLSQKGYGAVPTKPSPDGTIVEPPSGALLPKFGMWMMPDNESPGILEDFLRAMITEGDALLTHAEASVDGIPGETLFPEVRRPKALMHTWLAWQEDPGKPFGMAIKSRKLNAEAECAKRFASWLRNLFAPGG